MIVNNIEVKVGDVWMLKSGWTVTLVGVHGVCAWCLHADGGYGTTDGSGMRELLRRSGETEDRDRAKWQYSDAPGYNPADGAGLYGTGNPDVIRAPPCQCGGKPVECYRCLGTGEHVCPDCDVSHTCGKCGGSGKEDCDMCGGTGQDDTATNIVAGYKYHARYLRLLAALPGPVILHEPVNVYAPASIEFAGGKGLLCAMREEWV